MRAHCINTVHGDLWLSQNVPSNGSEYGVLLSVSAHDMAGTEWDLAESQVVDLAEACLAWLGEFGMTDRATALASARTRPDA